MPSVEAELRSALVADSAVTALAGTRIYPNQLPPNDETDPWIYYTIPEEIPGGRLDENDVQRISIEFELFASTYAVCRRLKKAVRAVLNTFRGTLVRRIWWEGSDSTPVEGGHNITEKFAALVYDEDAFYANVMSWDEEMLAWGTEPITWGI